MRCEEIKNNEERCFLFHGDNASLIDAIPDIIDNIDRPEKAMGMILSDPNGAGIPLDPLARLSNKCPKLDLVLNWNSTQFKRNRGAFGDDRPTMRDALDMLNKKHWLIRQPMGRWQWTLLIGRNERIGEHPALGFYHLESPKGQDIFRRCNFAKGIDPDCSGLNRSGPEPDQGDLLGAMA